MSGRGVDEPEDVTAALVATDPQALPATTEIRGTRAGVIVFGGILAFNVGNAVFHLIAARYLGPVDYSEVVSLLALSGIVSLPFVALQVLVARDVAASVAKGSSAAVSTLIRRTLGLAGVLGVLLMLALFAATPLIRRVLGIDDVAPVVLMAVITVPALLVPAVSGLAQGLQRFGVLTLSLAFGIGARLILLVALIAIGVTVEGTLAVMLISGFVAFLVPLVLLRRWLRTPQQAERTQSVLDFGRALVPIAVGTLAIASLTSVDLLFAKAMLPDEDAGIYGSASLIGRLILYVPATIATVLLPKVSSRAAADLETRDILGASLAITGAIAIVTTVVLAAAPALIVGLSFGEAFERAAPLLVLFGLAMSGYALLNILLTYHLGHDSARMSWLLLGGAVAQVGGYLLFHDSGRELLAVSIGVAVALLILHELLITPALRHTTGWVRAAIRLARGSRASA